MVTTDGISSPAGSSFESPWNMSAPSFFAVWAVAQIHVRIRNGVMPDSRSVQKILVPGIELRENVNSGTAVVAQSGKVVEQTFCVESYPHSSGDQTIELAPRMAASDSLRDE